MKYKKFFRSFYDFFFKNQYHLIIDKNYPISPSNIYYYDYMLFIHLTGRQTGTANNACLEDDFSS